MNEPNNARIPEGYPGSGPSIFEHTDIDLPLESLSYINQSILFRTANQEDWNSDKGEAILSYRNPYSQAQMRDYMQVYGDGTLLYSGHPESASGQYTSKYSRPVYSGTVEYERDGKQYRIKGTLHEFAARKGNVYYANGHDWLFRDVLQGALGIADTNRCPYPVIQSFREGHSIRVYASKYNRASEGDIWVYDTKTDITLDLTDMDAYGFIFDGNIYEKSGSSWIYLDMSDVTPVYNHEITSMDLPVVRYTACWDESLVSHLGFYYNSGEFDGDLRRYYPTVPNNCGVDGWPSHPYTSINIKRNNPSPYSFQNTVDGAYDTHSQRVFFRISKSDAPEKYRVYTSVDNVYKLAPVVFSASPIGEYPVYDDTYTQSGDSYSATTTNHTTLAQTEYSTSGESFDYRLIQSIINPNHRNKDAKYEI